MVLLTLIAFLTEFATVDAAWSLRAPVDEIARAQSPWFSPTYQPVQCTCDYRDPWDPAPTATIPTFDGDCLPCGQRTVELANPSDPTNGGRMILVQVRHRGAFYLAKVDPTAVQSAYMFQYKAPPVGHAALSFRFREGFEAELVPQLPQSRSERGTFRARELVFDIKPVRTVRARHPQSVLSAALDVHANLVENATDALNGTLTMLYQARTLEDLLENYVNQTRDVVQVFELDLSARKDGEVALFAEVIRQVSAKGGRVNYALTGRNCATELFTMIEASRGNYRTSGVDFVVRLGDNSYRLSGDVLPSQIKKNLKKRGLLKAELPRLR